jgi:hypothetical protein
MRDFCRLIGWTVVDLIRSRAGASVSRLKGLASGIRQVSDFAATYSAVGAGGAFVGGAGGVQLGSEKGVRIALQGPKAGMEFAANLSSINISLK